MSDDNIINVSVCSNCRNLTQMKPIKDDVYLCSLCNQQFKQYKNGKLVYIPIGIARAMGNKISFMFTVDEKLQNEVTEDISFESDLEFDFEFDPEFDPDETTE